MTMKKIFWAGDKKNIFGGIDLAKCPEIVNLLRKKQNDKTINCYDIAGKDRKGRSKAVRRCVIELSGRQVDKFFTCFKKRQRCKNG
ncbi:MAG: hypothetical protein HQK53_20295 [Oligoflexia bacterium]|nr:hypothetical protein [Oligoflexia bacterium]